MLKVNRHTERGTETRRYLPERHEAAWNEREYAVGKIAELEAENAELREVCIENARLRELVRDLYEGLRCPTEPDDSCPSCPFNSDDGCTFELRMEELGIEVEG